jgi:DNA-binding beta-propeller fold protein YncE
VSRLPLAACVLLGLAGAGSWLPDVSAASTYRLVENWATDMPLGELFGRVSGVASDPRGQVLVYRRDGGNIWTFDTRGRFLNAWGANSAKRTHAIRVDRNGFVWTTDDQGHQVKKWSPDHHVVLTLGTFDTSGESATTFNGPTDVAVAANGDIFVTDGYVNSRVVKFSGSGKFITAWGSKGRQAGQFNLPHSIIIDRRGRLLVADRENQRIQIFDQDGRFLDTWTNLGEPVALEIREDVLYVADAAAPKVWIAGAKDGRILGEIEGGVDQHSLAVDPAGKVYVGSVRSQYLKVYAVRAR